MHWGTEIGNVPSSPLKKQVISAIGVHFKLATKYAILFFDSWLWVVFAWQASLFRSQVITCSLVSWAWLVVSSATTKFSYGSGNPCQNKIFIENLEAGAATWGHVKHSVVPIYIFTSHKSSKNKHVYVYFNQQKEWQTCLMYLHKYHDLLTSFRISCLAIVQSLMNSMNFKSSPVVISWKFLIKYYDYSFDYLIIIMDQLWLTLLLSIQYGLFLTGHRLTGTC